MPSLTGDYPGPDEPGVNALAEGNGFAIFVSGRAPRSPLGHALVAPTAKLAGMLAAEWPSSKMKIDLSVMPATRLAFAALDAGDAERLQWAARLADFAEHDLICYIADGPEALVERQLRAWSPLREWADDSLGLTFATTRRIVHCDQPARTLQLVREQAEALDSFPLVGLVRAAQLLGSAVLALGLLHGRLDAPSAVEAATIDEAWQAEQWGDDPAAADRLAAIAAEARVLKDWFRALD